MEKLLVRPGPPLEGTVRVGGSKNSVLKLMAATLLTPGEHRIHGAPGITDVFLMCQVLEAMGLRATFEAGTISIIRPEEVEPEAPYELVEQMRASIVVLGPLLASMGEVRVSMPGGDDFGTRPIDLHLKGLELLGATFEQRHGVIEGRADRLIGNKVMLEFPSVGATENLLMAAVRAKGTTVIDNAAREPEIADLAAFLNRMGANVIGAGSSTIQIEGVDELVPVEHTVIPDRIEAATLLGALGVCGGEIVVEGARPDHMDMVTQKLGEMGMRISPDSEGIWAQASKRLRSVDVASLPYPGVATDCMPLFVALLALADGVGVATENIFGSNRWRYIAELVRMGADIRTEGHHAVIRGVEQLQSAPGKMHDIRAGAALVVAALGADGESALSGVDHVDRGYEDLVGKLVSLGADIERVGG